MVQSIYHLSDEQIKNLTMLEFYIKQKNLIFVARLYNPMIGDAEENKKKEEVLPGTAASLKSMGLIKGKKKKRRNE